MVRTDAKQHAVILFAALFAIAGNALHAQGGKTHLNVEYGRGITKAGTEKILLLDLFIPDGQGPFPVIAWIHGGAWLGGNKTLNPNGAQVRQVGRGYAVASIEYRLSQEALFPAQANDCKAAVRWLRSHASAYKLDPDRIGVWGSSAGGHLVTLLGTSGNVRELEDLAMGNSDQSSRVQAVVDWFGPTDLLKMNEQLRAMGCGPKQLTHDNADSPESLLVGCPVQTCPEKTAHANPIRYVTPDDPPFCIQHGSADFTVPYEQSVLLYNALRSSGVDARFDLFGETGHGGPVFGSGFNQSVLDAFWDKWLKGK